MIASTVQNVPYVIGGLFVAWCCLKADIREWAKNRKPRTDKHPGGLR